MNTNSPVEDYNHGFLQLRSGLTIYPSQDSAIDRVLSESLASIPARFIMLADISGQIISVRGDRGVVSEPVALGSLVAGDLAASREIARVLGEYQSYQMILREGKSGHTFITESGPYMVSLVQVDSDVPLGWARVMIKKMSQRLAAIVDTLPEELQQKGENAYAQNDVLSISDNENLSDLFGEALNNIWSGDDS